MTAIPVDAEQEEERGDPVAEVCGLPEAVRPLV